MERRGVGYLDKSQDVSFSSSPRRWAGDLDRLDRHLDRLDDRDDRDRSRLSSGRASPQDEPEDIFRNLRPLRTAGPGRLGRTKRSQSEHIYNMRSLRLAIPKPEDGVEELFNRLPDGMLSPKSQRLKELSEKVKKERRKSERLKMKGKAWTTMAENYKAQIDDYQESRDKIRSEVETIEEVSKDDVREFSQKYKELETSRVAEDEKAADRRDRSPLDERNRRRGDGGGRRKGDDYLIDPRLTRGSDRRSGDRDSRKKAPRRRGGDGGGGGYYWMSRAERRDSISRDSNGRRSLGSVGRRHTTFF